MKEELKKSLKEFDKKKIGVIGDLMLDNFIFGEIKRINPEQPAAPLVRVLEEKYILGGAANVANNIISFGAKCSLYGLIGEDFFGKKIKKLCKNSGIDFKEFNREKPTLVKTRVIAHGQQIARLDFEEAAFEPPSEGLKKDILRKFKEEIDSLDLVILSDYNKGFFDKNFVEKIILIAKEKNKKVLVDPKPSNIDFFKNCDLICPNKKEATEITGIKYSNGKEKLLKMGKSLSEKINSKDVIITCGKDGVFLYSPSVQKLISTKAKKIADVTGAGDTFISALSLGLASGLKLENATHLGNYAAGIVVGKVGTATTDIRELLEEIEKDKI